MSHYWDMINSCFSSFHQMSPQTLLADLILSILSHVRRFCVRYSTYYHDYVGGGGVRCWG